MDPRFPLGCSDIITFPLCWGYLLDSCNKFRKLKVWYVCFDILMCLIFFKSSNQENNTSFRYESILKWKTLINPKFGKLDWIAFTIKTCFRIWYPYNITKKIWLNFLYQTTSNTLMVVHYKTPKSTGNIAIYPSFSGYIWCYTPK